MSNRRPVPGLSGQGVPGRWRIAIEQCMRSNASHFATDPIKLVRDEIARQSEKAMSLYAQVMNQRSR